MSEARIEVRLQPRAPRDELLEIRDGVLRARVCAAPVDGQANRALCRLLAARLGVPPSAIEVIGGERGRSKLVRVWGIDGAALVAALQLPA
jgi:uncharacterized protein YggU (UPF0235/DUF167 family)